MLQAGDRLMRRRETVGWMDKKLSRPLVQCSVVLVRSMTTIPVSPVRHTHTFTHMRTHGIDGISGLDPLR